MSYKALLFCPDEKTARVVTQILTDLEFQVEASNEPFQAVKKLMAEHFDAIVVDCENEQNAALLFKSAHSSGSNEASLAVAVVEGQSGVAKAFRIGANLVLTKPINVEQSKGTLRVARGLLRKTGATKPATGASATSPRIAAASLDAERPPMSQIPEPKSATSFLPAQPLPSPIPAVSSSVFEVEDDPDPKPEPTEAALLESMPELLGNKNRTTDATATSGTPKDYPWQPTSKPLAGPMATALRRAAEATGRSDIDPSTIGNTLGAAAHASDSPVSRSFTTGTASGQAAAAAPAKVLPEPEERHETRQLDAPSFSSLGDTTGGQESGSSKKIILIAAVALVAAAALAYVGWSKMHSVNETREPQTQAAPVRSSPLQARPSTAATVPLPLSPAREVAGKPSPSVPINSTSTSPVEQGPDISLSTNEAGPGASKQSTPIVEPNAAVKSSSDANPQTLMVVKNLAPSPSRPGPVPEESAQPPAPGSLGVSEKINDQALSGIMSTATANLPRPVQQLKVSQGVSQGLLIKSVEPVYPPTARQMRIQGAVELLANIGKDGSITKVKLLSGDSVLSRSAIDAVKQWKYKPYYLNNQPVEIQTQITVKFKIP